MSNRNKPCACGSGLKFKRCCGDEAALCAKRIAAHAAHAEALQKKLAAEAEARKQQPSCPMRRSPMAAILLMSALAFSYHPTFKTRP